MKAILLNVKSIKETKKAKLHFKEKWKMYDFSKFPDLSFNLQGTSCRKVQ